MQWPQNVQIQTHSVMPHGHHLHRAHSFNDFGHHQIDGYPMQHSYGHRQSLSGSTQNFNAAIPDHSQANPMMHRAPSLPAHASYYVPEQNNPGVATLNTNPPAIQTYQIPRQLERQDIIQSSPSSYSPPSRASPASQELGFYTHQTQNAPYALPPTSSPIEQQPMMQYQQQLPHHLASQQAQPMPTPISQAPQVKYEPYQQAAPQEGQWYDNVAYQAPVEVINHVQTYPQPHLYADPWATKLEAYDDPSLQMPSARIENL
jgi:hypothetical protein